MHIFCLSEEGPRQVWFGEREPGRLVPQMASCRTTPPSIANQKRRKDKNPISNPLPLRLYLLNTILQKRKSSLSRTIGYHPTNNISDPTTHTPEREDGERITADPFPPLQQKRRPVLVTHHLH
ncbi:hypothetical protein CEXT_576941 [Caerostris extrusa]|uniref:Uncharacterized protein n=1 Tax=Caerostris extrusa TaxID=172846 RepID=A0AAV4XIM0_CAEEX|nr:hypothetical protein CEXT_576941 [Caerostris extrusa]